MKPRPFAVGVMGGQCRSARLLFESGRHEVYRRPLCAASTTFSTKEHSHVSSGHSLPKLHCYASSWQFSYLIHLFATRLLITLFFISTDASLDPPIIIGNDNFREYEGQQYIEKKAGGTLELNCSTTEAIKWILPDNTLYKGFNPQEVRFLFTKKKLRFHHKQLHKVPVVLNYGYHY